MENTEKDKNLAEKVVAKIEDWIKYSTAPFTSRSEATLLGGGIKGDRTYWGGRPGLDIADPLDVGYSTLSTLWRGIDKGLVRPLIRKGHEYSGDISPQNIQSQEDLIEFAEKYLPKEYVNYMKETGMFLVYHDDMYGENSFTFPFHGHQRDWPFSEGHLFQNHPWPTGGVQVSPLEEDHKGISPFVAAEELTHAERFLRGHPGSRFTGSRDMVDWLMTAQDEVGTKLEALGSMIGKESLWDIVRSIPQAVVSGASYVFPSSNWLDSGVPSDNEKITEFYDSVDAMEELGWTHGKILWEWQEGYWDGANDLPLEKVWEKNYPDLPFPEQLVESMVFNKDDNDQRSDLEGQRKRFEGHTLQNIDRWLNRY
tara:strand:- start:1475 stop:2578 length:1104 start_codon:yes stop_codon:yes gene_type:complete